MYMSTTRLRCRGQGTRIAAVAPRSLVAVDAFTEARGKRLAVPAGGTEETDAAKPETA